LLLRAGLPMMRRPARKSNSRSLTGRWRAISGRTGLSRITYIGGNFDHLASIVA